MYGGSGGKGAVSRDGATEDLRWAHFRQCMRAG